MAENIKRILICKLKFYGDVLLITPVIESLRARYPEAKIDLLLYKDTQAILAADPRVNQFYLVEKKTSLLKTIKNYCSLHSQLKENHYDLVINLTAQWSIALLIASLRRHSISFKRDKLRWDKLFTQVVQTEGSHIVEQNLSILKGLGFNDSQLKKETLLSYRESDYQALLAQVPTLASQRYVVIQPTSRQAFKCWDDDKFADVINHLHQNGLSVYLTCGPATDEQQQVQHIASLCDTAPDLTFAGKTTFLQLAALIDHATLYIGVDSAPMHMAAALDKPQVSLFGATKPLQWRPWSDKARVIWAGDYHPMPERKDLDRSQKYLTWIPVEVVNEAVDRILRSEEETA
jgi:heptosyltransferase-3